MCCHKHPDNGSDLAVADAGETDLRARLRQARDEAEAQVAELVAREVNLQAVLRETGNRLRWLSTYEKNPPEIVKDEFAYDRLLTWVREQARGWAAELLERRRL